MTTALSDAPGSSLPGLSTNHPSEVMNAPQRAPEPRQWTVYLHERGKRPRLAGVQVPDKFPGEITVGDKDYYWVGADISQRTLTYSDIKGGVS